MPQDISLRILLYRLPLAIFLQQPWRLPTNHPLPAHDKGVKECYHRGFLFSSLFTG